jgi:hypothetical protein
MAVGVGPAGDRASKPASRSFGDSMADIDASVRVSKNGSILAVALDPPAQATKNIPGVENRKEADRV